MMKVFNNAAIVTRKAGDVVNFNILVVNLVLLDRLITDAWSKNKPLLPYGDKDAGSMFLYNPKLYPKEHQRYDIDFKKYCCGAAGLCDEYKKRRPSSNCTGYIPPKSCKNIQ